MRALFFYKEVLIMGLTSFNKARREQAQKEQEVKEEVKEEVKPKKGAK